MKAFVKFFYNKKGYGFIESDSGEDYFVHYTNIISDDEYKKLNNGDRVVFEREDAPRGLSAVEVKKDEGI